MIYNREMNCPHCNVTLDVKLDIDYFGMEDKYIIALGRELRNYTADYHNPDANDAIRKILNYVNSLDQNAK